MNILKRIVAVALTLAMLCSLLTVAAPSVYALAGATKYGDGKIYAWGCDMSQWNVNGATYTDYSLVDFKKMKADGCDFVILRIGDQKPEYDRKADPTFPTLYKMAREAGLHVGAYYYCYKTTRAGAVSDAQFCIDIIEKNNMYFEYPIYFDVEAKNQESLSTSNLVDLCLGWCETMVDAGYFPGVYSTAAHSLNELQGSSKFNYDTWVAVVKRNSSGTQFDPTKDNTSYKTKYGMWQYKWYSESWSAPSYDGSYWKNSDGWPLDCNVAYRDYPTIMATYGYNNVVPKQTITFESNGGSAVDPVKVKNGDALEKPADPTRLGFDFAGWYCNPELTDPYDFSSPVPYDFTLYAKWTEAQWDAQTNLMPNAQQLQLNDFGGQGEIWPYWNNDSYGSLTMYNGVTNDSNWSWPSAYMTYQNSFDSVNNNYLYVKKDGDAQFNVTLTYLDKDGVSHELNLSDVANLSGTDFPAGALEEYYDVGSYIRNLGHVPASGNVKFTKVTYYCIGVKDSYVTLYDLKFVTKDAVSDPFKTLMTHNITQVEGVGNYTYNDGTLTMNAAADGYSVKMNTNVTFDPSAFANLLMNVEATAPFNVTVELTNGNGNAKMELRKEFFDQFGMSTGEQSLPAGDWNVKMNLFGYYQYNGGVVESSTIKSVTVTLLGEGTLTLNGLQISRRDVIETVKDGMTSSGELTAFVPGDVNEDGVVTAMDARLVLMYVLDSAVLSDEALVAADMNDDSFITTGDARAILLMLV